MKTRERFIIMLFTIFFILNNNIFSKNLNNMIDHSIGDTIKVLDKSYNYDARIYFFINLATCNICTQGINYILNYFNKYTIECVVFVSGVDKSYADKLAKKNKWYFPVIADHYGIYKDYYKIKSPPLMITLNNSGKILGIDDFTSNNLQIDSLVKLVVVNSSEQKQERMKKELIEIKRIKVKENGDLLSAVPYRKVLFSEKQNNFILSNMYDCDLHIIDSNGVVIKTINNNAYSNYNCGLLLSMSWAINQKILFLTGSPKNLLNDSFQYYDIEHDTVSKPIKLLPYLDTKKNSIAEKTQFLTGNDKFVCHIIYNGKTSRKLNDNDKLIYLFDKNGNKINEFETADSIFRIYKRSPKCFMAFAFDNKNNYLVSMQFSSKLIKFWDINGNNIKTMRLNLGKNFRIPKQDVNDCDSKSSRKNYISYINSTSLLGPILIDEKNSNILISYQNKTVPKGVIDLMSNDVIDEVYFNLYDTDGNKLNKEDILMPKYCYPFFLKDSYIYTTEINKGKLEIVIYKFEPSLN